MIDLEALQTLRQAEKDHDELQGLPTGFVEDLITNIKTLKEAMVDANYREQDLLRDQLKGTVESYLGLMDIRKGKLINQALLHHDQRTVPMLDHEARLFAVLWSGLEAHGEGVMTPIDAAYRRGLE